MEERITKSETRKIYFEATGETIEIIVNCEGFRSGDIPKSKNFLETMFKEIVKSIFD